MTQTKHHDILAAAYKRFGGSRGEDCKSSAFQSAAVIGRRNSNFPPAQSPSS